ncbi:MAG: hypothetical protein AAF231_00400 [Pseudomonadota bacterium]
MRFQLLANLTLVDPCSIGIDTARKGPWVQSKLITLQKHPIIGQKDVFRWSVDLKVGTSGFLRAVKSMLDYVAFYEVKLAGRPYLVIFLLVFSLVLPAAIMALGPRDWWLHRSWSLLIPALTITKFIWNLVRSGSPRVGQFQVNNKIRKNLKSAQATEQEEQLGFTKINRSSSFDGPVVLSDTFNTQKMCDANCDWSLSINKSANIKNEILRSLRVHSTHFVRFGRRAMLNSILRNKALINEKKVAFAEQFPPAGGTISVYQTDYFTSLCSAERRLEDVIAEENGHRHILIDAKDWKAVQRRGQKFRLPTIFDNSPPISLHIGIEVLAVSSDGVFRVAIQSERTEFSRSMRAPLGSGSVDWDDTAGAITLKAVIRNAARRELAEEWGDANLDVFQKLSQLTPEPIGYFRSVLRLGKPQFVCLVRLNCKDHELSADASEILRDTRACFDAHDLEGLRVALDSILSRSGDQVDSAPLLGAAHILRDLIRKRPERIREILRY